MKRFTPSSREIEVLFQEAGRVAFDFAKGPLLRISLLTLAPERHMLLVNAPSLCADAPSLENSGARTQPSLFSLYCWQGTSDEPLQYADLAEWENDLLESEDTQEGKKHWRERKPQRPVPTASLRTRPPAKAHLSPASGSPINPELTANIRTLVGKYDASTAVFFLACWQILLWRLTGQSDFVVGLACDGRTYEGLQEAVGLFGKTLPVPCHAGRAPSVE